MLAARHTLLSAMAKLHIAGGGINATVNRAKHTLPQINYDYKALEPIISGQIMEIHHTKHHQAYVNNYNAAEEQLQEAIQSNNTSKIIALGGALKFNGGGHLNHSIFWCNLSPEKSAPSDDLTKTINTSFGTFETFKKDLITTTTAIQGSGWGWLGYCKKSKSLRITTCANQDPLEATTGLVPLFGIDVWEHAYYLQYKNLRPNYVEAIFDIINWKDVSERLANAKK